jgi:small subunit ribosomal protein S8
MGSSPVFPIILKNESNSYLISHINLALSKKLSSSTIIFSNKILSLVRILYKFGCIYKFNIFTKNNKKFIKFTCFFYKNKPFFKGIRLISTSSRKYYISLKALMIVHKSLNSSILILSTPKGIISHYEAIKMRVGGLLLCILN